MARLLCVWEQGQNLGHLASLREPMEVALQNGHQVFLAARELHSIPLVLGDLPIAVLQAPFKQNAVPLGAESLLSYTHLIASSCFATVDELAVLVGAWRTLFDLVRPDCVLFEHSPTALIAALPYAFRKIHLGTGFTVPPCEPASGTLEQPFLPFPTTPRTPEMRQRLLQDDAQLRGAINTVQQRLRAPAIVALSDIYSQAHADILLTWPELDHFGARAGADYWGAASRPGGLAPAWPAAAGPRVFAYLQGFPGLERLLKNLSQAPLCCLLYVPGLPAALQAQYRSERLAFASGPVDLAQALQQAQWSISHASHYTVASSVCAGLPQLLIPRHQEQLFCALRLVQAGAALMAYQDQPDFQGAIARMLEETALSEGAKRLLQGSKRYDAVQVRNRWSAVFAQNLGIYP